MTLNDVQYKVAFVLKMKENQLNEQALKAKTELYEDMVELIAKSNSSFAPMAHEMRKLREARDAQDLGC